MTTNNVKVTTDLLFSSKGSNKTGTKGNSIDFGSIMDNNAKTTSKDLKGSDQEKVEKSNTSYQKNDKLNITNDKNEAKITTVEKDSKALEKGNETQKVDDLNEESGVEDIVQSTELIEKMIAMIKSQVQDTLNISEEELEKILETLGLTVLDLLNNDNLKQFVLQVNGASDITAALTNENLVNSIHNMLQTMDELKNTQGFQITEDELKAYLASVKGTDNLEEMDTLDDKVDKYNHMITSQDEVEVHTNVQKDIVVEVHRITEDSNDSMESDNSSNKNQNQDVSLQSPVNVFINNLATVSNDNLGFAEQIAYQRQLSDVTNQIVEQIKIIIKPEQTSMELNLNPDYLGKVNLSVVSKDGVLTAHFTTQTEIAKEAIESQIQILRENLNNQGLKVDAIEVTVSNFEFSQSNQASGGEKQENQSNNRHPFRDDETLNKDSDLDVVMNEAISEGSSIDYTA